MRIFVDCSYVDFAKQPTGIPRVVLKYLEEGYKWALKTDNEVIPVLIDAKGLLPFRPLPGGGLPHYLQRYVPSELQAAGTAEFDNAVERTAYEMRAVFAVLGLAPSLNECLRATEQAITSLSDKLENINDLYIATGDGDVLFCPAYWHDIDPKFYTSLQKSGVKIVTLCHDILPVSYPKFYRAPWNVQFEKNLIMAIKNSDLLCTVSKYTADSIKELILRKGIKTRSIEIAYNGYDELITPESLEEVKEFDYKPLIGRLSEFELIKSLQPYLMVGTIEPKKGHIPTIRSFEALWDAGYSRALVIIGRKGWLEGSVVEAIQSSAYYGNKLFWFDNFDDFDLSCAYLHCRGLVFSSYAEGFGIPMIEALFAGKPVIALRTPISAEIIGSYGHFFSTFPELAEHVLALEDDEKFARACAAAARYRWPSWNKVVFDLFDKFDALFALNEH